MYFFMMHRQIPALMTMILVRRLSFHKGLSWITRFAVRSLEMPTSKTPTIVTNIPAHALPGMVSPMSHGEMSAVPIGIKFKVMLISNACNFWRAWFQSKKAIMEPGTMSQNKIPQVEIGGNACRGEMNNIVKPPMPIGKADIVRESTTSSRAIDRPTKPLIV